MISQPMVVQLELGGWIKRNQNGLYYLVEFVQGFLRYREELQNRRRIRASAQPDFKRLARLKSSFARRAMPGN
jgi:hypothetical protein